MHGSATGTPTAGAAAAGQYSVRYLADSLRGCLIEVMARFVPVSAAEAALQSVEGLDDFAFVGRPEPTALQGLLDWLVKQQVGHLTLDNPPGRFIDAYNLELIDDLDRHPAVRAVLDDPTVQAGLAADQTAPDDLPTPPVQRPDPGCRRTRRPPGHPGRRAHPAHRTQPSRRRPRLRVTARPHGTMLGTPRPCRGFVAPRRATRPHQPRPSTRDRSSGRLPHHHQPAPPSVARHRRDNREHAVGPPTKP